MRELGRFSYRHMSSKEEVVEGGVKQVEEVVKVPEKVAEEVGKVV